MVTKPRGRADLFYQEVTDGGVLFDADGERVYVLNVVAAFIWNCCDGVHDAGEILEELASSLGPGAPDRKALQGDVDKSLADFQQKGLLES